MDFTKVSNNKKNVIGHKEEAETLGDYSDVNIIDSSLTGIEKKDFGYDGMQIVHAKTIEEIEALREPWCQLQQEHAASQISVDIDRYISILNGRQNVLNPHVVFLFKDNLPICTAIGRIEKHPLQCKIGYKNIMTTSLKGLCVEYDGIFGRLDEAITRRLLGVLMSLTKSKEVDLICLNHVKVDSLLYKFSQTLPAYFCRGRFNKIEVHWSMTVPEDIEDFYQARTRNHRHNLKKKVRRFEKEFSGRTKIVTYRHENELEEAATAAEKISSRTYQHGLGVGFIYDSALRSMLSTAAEKGWMRMSIIYVDEEPCAFQLGFYYGNMYYLDQVGYDHDWGKWSIGTVLFIKVLEDLCKEPSINRFDFGFGDADYKRNYSDRKHDEETVYIFAPRLYPMMIKGLKSTFHSLDSNMSSIIHKVGIGKKIKKAWRQCLRN